MMLHDLSQIVPTCEILNLKNFSYFDTDIDLLLVLIGDLIHHRLRDSHQIQPSMMNFNRKVVGIKVGPNHLIY